MAALEAAGIDRDQLDGVSTTGRANEFVFGVPGGAPLISMRSGAASSGAAHGSSTVDRHRLRDLLLSSLPADAVRWGAAVRGYTPLSDGSGVRVRCSDGTEHEGCLLVGADGVRSPVRAQLVGDLLRSTGVLTLGGRVPSTLVPMFSSMMAATGAACGMRLADPRAPGSSALYTGDGSSLFCTHGDLPCGPSGRVQHAFAFSFGMLLDPLLRDAAVDPAKSTLLRMLLQAGVFKGTELDGASVAAFIQATAGTTATAAACVPRSGGFIADCTVTWWGGRG